MEEEQIKTTNSKLLLKTRLVFNQFLLNGRAFILNSFGFLFFFGVFSFKSVKTIDSIYTGGKVLITDDESLLITTLNEDIEVTELSTGKQVHRLEGVSLNSQWQKSKKTQPTAFFIIFFCLHFTTEINR